MVIDINVIERMFYGISAMSGKAVKGQELRYRINPLLFAFILDLNRPDGYL